ncbi:hypothetical protein [Azospirillum sp.]|uniref:hypothetical protein n=1 Tax=Azospirillum sp. TaxID=34012 RepID=UPI003D75C3F5
MADGTYQTKVYDKLGGDQMVVASGGSINIETGGKILANGTQASAIVSLTDSTGGTANDTLAAVGATNGGDVSGVINSNFADLGAKVNAILAALRGAGIVAS